MQEEDSKMYSSLSTVMKEENPWAARTRNAEASSRDVDNEATCPMCLDDLGQNGGPASLACGHNGCFGCLQKVQANSRKPLCPVCRTPFNGDSSLGPDYDLRDALDRAETAEKESERQASSWQQQRSPARRQRPLEGEQPSQALALTKSSSQSQSRRLIYDLPLPEETGAWIPVSVPPKGYKDRQISPSRGEGAWYAAKGQYEEARQALPEVNLWNVLNGFINIISGKSITQMIPEDTSTQTWPELAHRYSARSGLVTPDNPWRLNHAPSAPPLLQGPNEETRERLEVLNAEPPQWIADSFASACMQCSANFRAVSCGRHHCRLCGGIFCWRCSSGRCLLPVKFRERSPQRVCDVCWERLQPVQRLLVDRVSNAAQVATHDVTDMSCMRAWLNNPLGLTMEDEIYKATNTLRSYFTLGELAPEKSIPDAVLNGAKGLAILTVFKMGLMVTYKAGTGLVVARKGDGTWSAPSAIASCGLGWGAQAGGELTDFIIVLRTSEAVNAFCGRVHLAVGAGLSVAAGPVGRAAEADLRAGDGGAAACYTYSRSKGAFVGCSLEGNVVATRSSANTRFYGDPTIIAVDILMGQVAPPRAAAPLYNALSHLFAYR